MGRGCEDRSSPPFVALELEVWSSNVRDMGMGGKEQGCSGCGSAP